MSTKEDKSIEVDVPLRAADAASSWGDSGKVGDPGWEPPRRAMVDPPDAGLIGTFPVGMPPEPGDHGLLPTDAAAGFGDPESEREPGVVERR